MSKNKASFALWEAGHKTLARNLKNLTREQFEKIFGEKKEDISQFSQILSQATQGHGGEILGRCTYYFSPVSLCTTCLLKLFNYNISGFSMYYLST